MPRRTTAVCRAGGALSGARLALARRACGDCGRSCRSAKLPYAPTQRLPPHTHGVKAGVGGEAAAARCDGAHVHGPGLVCQVRAGRCGATAPQGPGRSRSRRCATQYIGKPDAKHTRTQTCMDIRSRASVWCTYGLGSLSLSLSHTHSHTQIHMVLNARSLYTRLCACGGHGGGRGCRFIFPTLRRLRLSQSRCRRRTSSTF
jgi:hypothetical protein